MSNMIEVNYIDRSENGCSDPSSCDHGVEQSHKIIIWKEKMGIAEELDRNNSILFHTFLIYILLEKR